MTILVPITEAAILNPGLPRELSNQPEREVHFVPMADVSENGTLSINGTRKLGDVLKGYTYFENGDVLVAKITPCMENGKAALVEGLPLRIAFGSTEFHVLRPKPGVSGRYLFYMVWNSWFRKHAERNMTGTAGQKRVPAAFFETFKIPLPHDIKEQQRIAAILDKADSIRRRVQGALRLYRTIAKSIFHDRFGDPLVNRKGWNVVDMETLYEIPPNYGTMLVPSDTTGGWLDLRVANIQSGELDLSDKKYVNLSQDMIQRHEACEGDLLLARAIGSQEHLGKCIIAKPGSERWAFDSHLMRVRFDRKKVEPRYIQAFLSTPGGRHEFLRNSRRSAVQFNINTKELARIQVPLPPLSSQREFVRSLELLDRIAQSQTTVSREMEALFGCLVHRAFRGDL